MKYFVSILLCILHVAVIQASSPLRPGYATLRGKVTLADSVSKMPSGLTMMVNNLFAASPENLVVPVSDSGDIDFTFRIPHAQTGWFALTRNDILLVPGDTVVCDIVIGGPEIRSHISPQMDKVMEYIPYGGASGWTEKEAMDYVTGLTSVLDNMICALSDSARLWPGKNSAIEAIITGVMFLLEARYIYDTPLYSTELSGENKTIIKKARERKKLDLSPLYGLFKKYPALLTENPAFVMESEVAINRLEFSEYLPLVYGMKMPSEVLSDVEKLAGIGKNSLLAQIILTRHAIRKFKEGPEFIGEKTDMMEKVIPAISNEDCAVHLVEWSRNELCENKSSDIRQLPKELETLLAPYSGKPLFVDFWNINCGPCRHTMLSQRETERRIAEKGTCCFVYVSDDYGKDRDRAELWIEENGIGGEHLFIGKELRSLLNGKLNFSGIPFSILVSSDLKTWRPVDGQSLVLEEEINAKIDLP